MSTIRNPIEAYVLGNSAQEQARLKLQGGFLEKWTEQFFVLAGLEPGMSVLDLGCGMGDVSLLAARLVGTKGQVIGIVQDWERAFGRYAAANHDQIPNYLVEEASTKFAKLRESQTHMRLLHGDLHHIREPYSQSYGGRIRSPIRARQRFRQ